MTREEFSALKTGDELLCRVGRGGKELVRAKVVGAFGNGSTVAVKVRRIGIFAELLERCRPVTTA